MSSKKGGGCEATKGENGPHCQHGQNVLEDITFCGEDWKVCGVHHKQYLNNPDNLHLARRPVQEQESLIKTLEPGSATPRQLPTAVKVVGKAGVKKSRKSLAKALLGGFMIHAIRVMNSHPLTGHEFFVVGTGASGIHGNPAKMRTIKDHYVKPMLERAKAKYGDNLVVVSGGGRGFDYLLAKAAIELGIRLWIVLPSDEYIDFYWRQRNPQGDQRALILNKCEQAELILYVNPTHIGRDKRWGHANLDRNEAMVRLAVGGRGALLVYDPRSSGTSNTVHLAREMKVFPIREIPLVKSSPS